MVFHWSFSFLSFGIFELLSLNDSKSPQVSRTLLSILTDLDNAVVWVVFARPLISKFFNPCISSFVTGPTAPIIIGITVIFMFHSFCSSLARSRYLSLFSISFSFTLWSAGTEKSTIRQVLFFSFFFFYYQLVSSSGRYKMVRLYLEIPENFMRVSFSMTDSGLCIYHLFVWSNLKFLHNSQRITLPTQ